MPQIRIMGDDLGHVESVIPKLLKLIADHGLHYGLVAGDPTQLTHRRGGGRVVFDLTDAKYVSDRHRASTRGKGSDEVVVERVDTAQDRPRPTSARRALPRGGGR